MLLLSYLLIFLFGASLASGLLVCAQRLPERQSILAPRSRCANCHHPLSWWQLLPVLSYPSLKGRCYYCQSAIPRICFFAEISGGLISVSLWAAAKSAEQLIFTSCLFSGLFLFSLIDIQHQVLLPILFWPWLLLLASLKAPQLYYVTAIVTGLIFAAFAYCSKGLGSGDVELLAGLALLANVDVINYLLIGLSVSTCKLSYLSAAQNCFHPLFKLSRLVVGNRQRTVLLVKLKTSYCRLLCYNENS